MDKVMNEAGQKISQDPFIKPKPGAQAAFNRGECPMKLEELIDPSIRAMTSPEQLMANGTKKLHVAEQEGQNVINAEFELYHIINENPIRPTKDYKGIHIDNKIIVGLEKWGKAASIYCDKYGDKEMQMQMKAW